MTASLTACGGEEKVGYGDPTASGFEAVKVEGEIGSAPTVTWDAEMTVDEPETKTLVEGTGETIEKGDTASAYLWIGNGTTQQEAYSDYESGQPSELVASEDQLSPVFADLLTGAKTGSRLATVTTSEEVFGETGNPQLGIGNADTVLIVLDVMEKVVPPKPVDVPADQMPKLVEKDGKPVGFDFRGIAEPDPAGELKRTVLTEGDGEVVTLESTITANYLGMTHGAKEPFDESYSKEPAEFALTGVVEGWTYGLEGLKVGSRVLLEIPPSAGYGDQEQANIPANSTLYFVVDIVSVK